MPQSILRKEFPYPSISIETQKSFPYSLSKIDRAPKESCYLQGVVLSPGARRHVCCVLHATPAYLDCEALET